MPGPVSLSNDEARRLALGALGFGAPRLTRPATKADVRKLVQRLHLFQIDAVNVLVRAQYLPAFSRLGVYPLRVLDELAYTHRALFEASGHAESLLDVQLEPLLRWRHAEAERWADYFPAAYVKAVLAQVRDRGPLAPTDLEDPGVRRAGMWGRSKGKSTLEWLRSGGEVAVAGRRGLEQLYDLTERVIPPEVLDRPTPDAHEARKELLMLGAQALGVGTAKDIADYFRIRHSAKLLTELVTEGRLLRAQVEGWAKPAFVHPAAKAPKAIAARALVSPFDPLVWERDRTERLFGFRYRIEIYVRPHERTHGYYVLPFLLGDALVARVDLKQDRKQRALLVQDAHAEPGRANAATADALAEELRLMADWLELDRIEVRGSGDLTKHLARALKR